MRNRSARLAVVLALLSGFLLVPRLRAQAAPSPADRPAFDAVSIKPNKSGDGRALQQFQPGGRYVAANVTLGTLIDGAYQLRRHQRIGGPDWIDSERFDIEAKADTSPTRDQWRLMQQSLLADRFKLTVHHE